MANQKAGAFDLLKNDSGFTLIELMIVITVIGILATIALPQFASVRDAAGYTEAQAEMKNIQTALEMHFSSNQEYPSDPDTDLEGVADSVADTYFNGGDYDTDTNTDDEITSYVWTYTGDDYIVGINSNGQFAAEEGTTSKGDLTDFETDPSNI